MKRIRNFTLLGICCLVFVLSLTACNSKAKEIAELELKIEEIEERIDDSKDSLASYQSIYNEAKDTYNQYKYSSSASIQSELNRTKEYMDEAQKKINEYTRSISLDELSLEHYQERLEELKSE